jgi:23S rRNA pseudouridine2605 synthase
MTDRLAKVIAHAGICSRRQAEQLIAEGRVQVDGKTILTPAFTVTAENQILVDGKLIQSGASIISNISLWRYYKPVGVLCTRTDDFGRHTLTDVLAHDYPDLPRVVSVGRLDLNSEGLLLLTNYGPLARYFEMPANQFKRTYKVRIYGALDPQALKNLSKGVTIEGIHYEPIHVTLYRESEGGRNNWITVELTEGKNREIRKVMEYLGYKVSRLIRIGFGPCHLDDMRPGQLEELTVPKDIVSLLENKKETK